MSCRFWGLTGTCCVQKKAPERHHSISPVASSSPLAFRERRTDTAVPAFACASPRAATGIVLRSHPLLPWSLQATQGLTGAIRYVERAESGSGYASRGGATQQGHEPVGLRFAVATGFGQRVCQIGVRRQIQKLLDRTTPMAYMGACDSWKRPSSPAQSAHSSLTTSSARCRWRSCFPRSRAHSFGGPVDSGRSAGVVQDAANVEAYASSTTGTKSGKHSTCF